VDGGRVSTVCGWMTSKDTKAEFEDRLEVYAAAMEAGQYENADMELTIMLLPIKLAREREEEVQRRQGFLSVGGRDLVLDLADLLILVVARYFVEY